MSPTASLEEILHTRRIVVCVGTGGVGKTTLAAALGLAAARAGRRALVVTIDPARRLADALGVAELGNEPFEIAGDSLGATPSGSLHAVMLDAKSTFDGMVERFAESPEARDRILENRIYRHLSGALAGSSEYAAMERVFELLEGGGYDVIVLDTPPAQHAFDFLDAPRRLIEFFESRIVQILIQPALRVGRLGFGFFRRGARRVLGLIESVSGVSFLEDLSDFLFAFEGIAVGFLGHAEELRRLLFGPDSAFILVTGPHPDLSESAATLLERLVSEKAPLAGVIANRMRTWPGNGDVPENLLGADADPEDTARLAALLPPPEASSSERARAAVNAARGYALGVSSDRRQVSKLREATLKRRLFFRSVPEFESDVHDLQALQRVIEVLSATPKEATRG